MDPGNKFWFSSFGENDGWLLPGGIGIGGGTVGIEGGYRKQSEVEMSDIKSHCAAIAY